jgi:hypothetical protein
MSNCDFVAGRSLIALVTPKPALHAPALGAACALTRPNQSAQWLPSGRLLTMKVMGPNDVITNHGIEHGDRLAHDRNDHDLRHLASVFEALTERLEHRIPIARAHRCHVEGVTNWRTTAPDATQSRARPSDPADAARSRRRGDRMSSKLIRGLRSKRAAGFRSRRGRYDEPTPITPHDASFASYKAAGVQCRAWWYPP